MIFSICVYLRDSVLGILNCTMADGDAFSACFSKKKSVMKLNTCVINRYIEAVPCDISQRSIRNL
jgi:hypothetical protein